MIKVDFDDQGDFSKPIKKAKGKAKPKTQAVKGSEHDVSYENKAQAKSKR